MKEPVISCEPKTVTGTTRDRPGKREFFLLAVFFSVKIRDPFVRGRGVSFIVQETCLYMETFNR